MGCGTLSINAIAPESTQRNGDTIHDFQDVGSISKDPIPKDVCYNEEVRERDKRTEAGDKEAREFDKTTEAWAWNGNPVARTTGEEKADSQPGVTDSVFVVQPAAAWAGDPHKMSSMDKAGSELSQLATSSNQQQGTEAESDCVFQVQPAGTAAGVGLHHGGSEGGRKGEAAMKRGHSGEGELEAGVEADSAAELPLLTSTDGQGPVKVQKKEKKAKEAQKKTKKKEGKSSGTSISGLTLDDFTTAVENPFVPQFVFKCVSYIEKEGMRTEGLYRIPGNKAQGELFVSKFSSDPNVDISTLEIPVNAIATLLKSFFSDLSEALIPSNLCDELMEAGEMSGNKSERLIMLRGVIKKLPNQNLEVLKYLISHLYKVSENSAWNSMSSRNLAKCWWPTLMRLQFKSYEKMIQGSQIPEDIVHALIEQCPFFFYGGNEQ